MCIRVVTLCGIPPRPQAVCQTRDMPGPPAFPPGWAARDSPAAARFLSATEKRNISIVAEWWSIEVLHGGFPAYRWQEEHDSELIEAALTNGARDGRWHAGRWGVAFEVLFDTEEQWERFRSLPAVRAALDSVPDPVNGLLIYRGLGGGAGSRKPRRPRPSPTAGAMELPEPGDETWLDVKPVSGGEPAAIGAGIHRAF